MESQSNCCLPKNNIESEQSFKLKLRELPDQEIYITVSASLLCDVISVLDKRFNIEIRRSYR